TKMLKIFCMIALNFECLLIIYFFTCYLKCRFKSIIRIASTIKLITIKWISI
ncbi:hypothetical protein CP02DC14_1235, partial [Chlamydia psittaci 02DC14]